MESVPMKVLNDITECPVCKQVYTDPRALPCMHTYCLTCLETCCKDRRPPDKIDCPLCRKTFDLPSNGPRDLPKNFYVGQLLQARDVKQNEEPSTPCDVCSYELPGDTGVISRAVMCCPECEEYLCEVCASCHRKQTATRSHKLTTVSPALKQLRPEDVAVATLEESCDKHPGRVLYIYCFDCRVVICMLCRIENHKWHAHADLFEVEGELRSRLKNDVHNSLNGVTKCQELSRTLRKKKADFVEKISKNEEEIRKQSESSQEPIDNQKRKLNLLQKLRGIRQKKMKEIGCLDAEIEERLLALENLWTCGEEVLNKGTACEIARSAGWLHDRADELLKFDVIERSLADLGRFVVTFTSSDSNLCETLEPTDMHSANEDRYVRSSSPALIHIIPEGNPVPAVACLDDHGLYVVREYSEEVEVYNAVTLTLQRRLSVPRLGAYPLGLAASAISNCLYVSNYSYLSSYSYVYRVKLTGSNAVKKWSVGGRPTGLSVTNSGSLLVTCWGDNMLQEYTGRGTLLREVYLQKDVASPWHAVQLSSGEFVVSHEKPVHSVSVVERDGRVLRSYTGGSVAPGLGRVISLRSFVASRDGCILVCDTDNNRVLVLNSSLTSAQELPLPDGLWHPFALCLNESRGWLYVVEEGRGSVLVYNNVKLVKQTSDVLSDQLTEQN